MAFQELWEGEIYKKNKKFNKYPFSRLVSIINNLFKNKKK